MSEEGYALATQQSRHCKKCGGIDESSRDTTPVGWYAVTAGVPDTWGLGKGYQWVGMYCGLACLLADAPRLERQERLAHEVYKPARVLMPLG